MYYFIFFYTFILSLKTSWTYNNFTYLSYQKDLRIHFLIWITIISTFLLYKVIKLFKQTTYLTLSNKLLIIFTYISLLFGAYLPYYPDNENIISMFHVIISSLGALSLLVIIQLLINRIMVVDFSFYQKIATVYHRLIIFIGMFMIMFGCINSIVELFYTFTVLFTLFKIEQHFKKEQ